MDAPQIRYARTEDGVSIAFWTMGKGGTPLLLGPPVGYGHISLECQVPEMLAWYQQLAARRMIVRFDPRCHGMSQRDIQEHSMDASCSDIQAILGQLSFQQVDIFSMGNACTVTVAFAAQQPDRVGRLVLWSPSNLRDFFDEERRAAVVALAKTDWKLFTETYAHMSLGWSPDSRAHDWAIFIRQSVTQQDLARMIEAAPRFDVTPYLGAVQAPTLVLEDAQLELSDPVRYRLFASNIPNARLVRLDDGALTAFQSKAGTTAMEEFLSEAEEIIEEPPTALPEGMTAILFLDIADSTALTTQLGDAAYRERERELDASLRAAITAAGGTPVEGKVLGDGVMAVFTSARQAIDAAVRCRDLGNEAGLPLHLGIHAGDVVREVDPGGRTNVHGGAVQLASRVQSAATPGEILVSATVRDLARTSAGVAFEDRGEHELKGIAEPQRLFAVREQE